MVLSYATMFFSWNGAITEIAFMQVLFDIKLQSILFGLLPSCKTWKETVPGYRRSNSHFRLLGSYRTVTVTFIYVLWDFVCFSHADGARRRSRSHSNYEINSHLVYVLFIWSSLQLQCQTFRFRHSLVFRSSAIHGMTKVGHLAGRLFAFTSWRNFRRLLAQ